MKQQLNEEFRRMQKLAGTKLGENIEEVKEDLFSKYKTKIETLRDEFVSDLKSNLKDLKKLSKEDKTKLSQMIRNLTVAVDDALS
jgi:vacuolar-type H+-ATPase subunit H